MARPAQKRITGLFKRLGSLLLGGQPGGNAGAADWPGRIVRPRREDSRLTHPSVGLTPSRVLAYQHAADAGSPQMLFELYGEMLQKWPRLAAVENTRRLALTGLDWEIVAADGESGNAVGGGGNTAGGGRGTYARGRACYTAGGGRGTYARGRACYTAEGGRGTHTAGGGCGTYDVVEYCRDVLHSLERLDEALDHLADAIGFGISVLELVWDAGRLVDVVPVPHTRLIGDPHEPWRLRVVTDEEPSLGVALDELPAKWVIHKSRCQPGRHFEGGLLRASLPLYLAQNLSFKDWLIYSQIAGMPVRVAQFEPGTPEADKRELLKMLEALGTDAVAAFSKNVELKFIEAARRGEPTYPPLQQYCNTEVTILWLGQHLTTDVTSSGSFAAAQVHDRVREDLLVDDIADEARSIRRDLLTPLVRAKFGPGTPVPRFRRSLIQSVDTKVLADTLAVAVNELGLAVPRAWMHAALGIPQPGIPHAESMVKGVRS